MKKVIVNSVVEYIEQSLELFRVDIDCLVKYSGYSRRQLQLIFREYTGMPLGKYIRSRRICRSALLLRLTTLPLSEISNRLFYDSQQSFQREFKKSIGITPLSYRKKMCGEVELLSSILIGIMNYHTAERFFWKK
ncbi:helix-turn-helix transcriptional regulator [Escherichia coli]|uniref:helix-turn-helix transcriptional regulator n=1 Tax=Escherichia coli TaxID=562 RepID=UPI003CCBAD66